MWNAQECIGSLLIVRRIEAKNFSPSLVCPFAFFSVSFCCHYSPCMLKQTWEVLEGAHKSLQMNLHTLKFNCFYRKVFDAFILPCLLFTKAKSACSFCTSSHTCTIYYFFLQPFLLPPTLLDILCLCDVSGFCLKNNAFRLPNHTIMQASPNFF